MGELEDSSSLHRNLMGEHYEEKLNFQVDFE